MVLADSLNRGQDGAVHLIEPGAGKLSLLYQRNATLASDQRMPPLGTNQRDEAYLELLERWIESLGPDAP